MKIFSGGAHLCMGSHISKMFMAASASAVNGRLNVTVSSSSVSFSSLSSISLGFKILFS